MNFFLLAPLGEQRVVEVFGTFRRIRDTAIATFAKEAAGGFSGGLAAGFVGIGSDNHGPNFGG
jgi:hypothetical protein